MYHLAARRFRRSATPPPPCSYRRLNKFLWLGYDAMSMMWSTTSWNVSNECANLCTFLRERVYSEACQTASLPTHLPPSIIDGSYQQWHMYTHEYFCILTVAHSSFCPCLPRCAPYWRFKDLNVCTTSFRFRQVSMSLLNLAFVHTVHMVNVAMVNPRLTDCRGWIRSSQGHSRCKCIGSLDIVPTLFWHGVRSPNSFRNERYQVDDPKHVYSSCSSTSLCRDSTMVVLGW